MGDESINKRILSMLGRIDGHKMRIPNNILVKRIGATFPMLLSNMNLHIYDKSGQKVTYIRSKVSKWRRDHPDKDTLVMINYLQLIRSDRRYENKNMEVVDITRSLKELAKIII
ncbi:DnaB-like helicase C-terminal domain-containing protein [Virgibacillus ndiopensis]|uniref:DnaB-like helicase C-terminal domain-containing protein n=1 Tax=Virgibacillus ndiopensis TaxID=2004408 RepID=UPI000C08A854|nr:DnaB-like helicase C-terminal domain-containing protein [Virgibacillus ndiopensis]